MSLGTSLKRSLVRGRHGDGATHLSASPDARKSGNESMMSMFNASMRRGTKLDEKLQVEPHAPSWNVMNPFSCHAVPCLVVDPTDHCAIVALPDLHSCNVQF